MAREFIPRSIEECTAEWLTQVLGSDVLDGARVERVEAELLGEGEGFMGTIARLHLHLDREVPGAPATLIAKIPTRDRAIKAQGELLGLYEREVFFYEEFASKLPKAPPRCFYAAMDPNPNSPETQRKTQENIERLPGWLIRLLIVLGRFVVRFSRRRYVMLLEDMAPARVGNQLEGGTEEEVEAMLRFLARMHARFWNSQELAATHWIPGLDTSPRVILMMFRRALPKFLATYGDRVSHSFRELLDWLNERVIVLVHEFQRGPFTLVHGDFRLDNVFFADADGDEIDVVLFDWQIPARGPAAYDVAYFLSSTLDPGTSPERVNALLRIYHDRLLEEGVEDYDFEALQRDYRRALLLMVQRITAGLAEIGTTNDRGRELFETWIDRLVAQVEGLDPDSVLSG